MKISQSKFRDIPVFSSFSHTDLACESAKGLPDSAICSSSSWQDGDLQVFETSIRSDEAASGSAAPGRYITVFCSDLREPLLLCKSSLSGLVSRLLLKLIGTFPSSRHPSRILVAGLGNRAITSDSIGSLTAEKVTATAHLNCASPQFASLGIPSVSVITPGVASQTGIETARFIKSISRSIGAELMIAVDSLAAKSTERLCATIQLSTAGIRPGSGIGNHREAITEDTMGIPVIAIGVPTVISYSTLACEALKSTGGRADPTQIHAQGNLFVSHGESDTICQCAAEVIAAAINQAFTGEAGSI